MEILAFGGKESWARLNKRLVCFQSRLLSHHPSTIRKRAATTKLMPQPHQLMEDSPTYKKIVDSNQSQILQTQIFILKNDIMSNWEVQQSNSTKEET
jgi:hypothetical protein